MPPIYVTPRQLKLMSPSGTGKFAQCPKRLIAEADHPEWDEESGPAACFGTVCHYGTQLALELPPPKPPSEHDFVNAKRVKHLNTQPITDLKNLKGAPNKKAKEVYDFICETFGKPPDPTPTAPLDPASYFDRLVEVTCNAAVSALPVLPEKVRWVPEHHANLPTLLPNRIGKTGNRGYSGSIDLMRSDRSELWDLKFPGAPVLEAQYLYIVQLASYHIITGIPRTGLLFVPVGGRNVSRLLIDWRSPGMKDLCDSVRGFIEWTDDESFRRHAWYIPGEGCDFCYRNPGIKKWPRPNVRGDDICPIYRIPEMVNLSPSSDKPTNSYADLAPSANDEFLQQLRAANDAAAGLEALAPNISADHRAKLDASAPTGINLF